VGESSFWYRPTRVVPDQRPLNGRCCCCITCRLTAADWDQLRNPTLGNRVWATFFRGKYRYDSSPVVQFYRVMLCKRCICCRRLSVRLSVTSHYFMAGHAYVKSVISWTISLAHTSPDSFQTATASCYSTKCAGFKCYSRACI